jgi:hypothetical protein
MSVPGRLSIALCTALFVACSSAVGDKPGPPPTCPSCPSATTISGGVEASGGGVGGGSTGSGAGGDGQGGGETATVSGDVVVVDSLAFNSTSVYANPAFVYGDAPSGKEIGQPYDGVTFTIDGVARGNTWFLVVPTDTTDTVFPTYSKRHVAADKLSLSLLDQQVLTAIGLDAGLALSTLHAQIVLRVTDGKNPIQGITAESAGAGLILYDFGPTSYSIQNNATGDRGTIVLLNQSSTSITLTDAAANIYHVDVRPEAGTATLLDLVL